MGEFLYFAVYVVQQLGIMLGVGAQTVLLCTHLLVLHRGEVEKPNASYARAAKIALGTSFALIIASGAGAVVIHLLANQIGVILAPAFLFKWGLIAALLVAVPLQQKFLSNNIFYAFTGGTWYALFLVHSLGPVTSWTMLGALYASWLVAFAIVWMAFVAIMRKRSVVTAKPMLAPQKIAKKEPVKVAPVAVKIVPHAPVPVAPVPKPIVPPAPKIEVPIPVAVSVPPPVPKLIPLQVAVAVSTPAVVAKPSSPAPAPIKPVVAPPAAIVTTIGPSTILSTEKPSQSWWNVLRLWFIRHNKDKKTVSAPVAVAQSAATPAPSPVAQIVTQPAPVIPPPKIEEVKMAEPLTLIKPENLPTEYHLELNEPHRAAPAPAPAPVAPQKKEEAPTPTLAEEIIDHLLVPALRIMPKSVADIGTENRPPVVRLS